MSGRTADSIQNRGTLADDLPCLSKPVVPAQLPAKIRDLLDGQP